MFSPNKNLSFLSNVYYDIISNLFLSIYKVQENNENGIFFENQVYDIADIKVGRDTILNLPLTNYMNKPLIIHDVTSSCGCTVVDWEKKPLPPNQKSNIKVLYKSTDKGTFNKSIIIKSNAPNNPVKLILKGTGIE